MGKWILVSIVAVMVGALAVLSSTHTSAQGLQPETQLTPSQAMQLVQNALKCRAAYGFLASYEKIYEGGEGPIYKSYMGKVDEWAELGAQVFNNYTLPKHSWRMAHDAAMNGLNKGNDRETILNVREFLGNCPTFYVALIDALNVGEPETPNSPRPRWTKDWLNAESPNSN